ncbi:MAG TPA: cytochrome o ubiquinol oxidase subunit III [Patescibacteria group bacterium]|nr:cytochrome o ubiquinol oxidase subunit III [Patescibacteria group bacterium]
MSTIESVAALSPVKLTKAEKKVEEDNKSIFGFWLYLMTDCVLFASLFATYAVLHNNNFGGQTAHQLFSMPYALAETLILLTSSFSCGLSILTFKKKYLSAGINWLIVTFVLGVSFITLELGEFIKLYHQGNRWQRSGFLSSYFTLVGTHGLHITIGLIWMIVMIWRLLSSKAKLNRKFIRQLTLLSLFWHFLDVVWIFIFSIVYLFGGLGI